MATSARVRNSSSSLKKVVAFQVLPRRAAGTAPASGAAVMASMVAAPRVGSPAKEGPAVRKRSVRQPSERSAGRRKGSVLKARHACLLSSVSDPASAKEGRASDRRGRHPRLVADQHAEKVARLVRICEQVEVLEAGACRKFVTNVPQC